MSTSRASGPALTGMKHGSTRTLIATTSTGSVPGLCALSAEGEERQPVRPAVKWVRSERASHYPGRSHIRCLLDGLLAHKTAIWSGLHGAGQILHHPKAAQTPLVCAPSLQEREPSSAYRRGSSSGWSYQVPGPKPFR